MKRGTHPPFTPLRSGPKGGFMALQPKAISCTTDTINISRGRKESVYDCRSFLFSEKNLDISEQHLRLTTAGKV